MKCHVEDEAKNLCRIAHKKTPSMNEGLAKATVSCLSRMSWRAAADVGEVEELADMPLIIRGRLKLFQQEPRTVQEIMLMTLQLVVYHIAEWLKLPDTVTRCWYYYHQTGIDIPVTVQERENLTIWHQK